MIRCLCIPAVLIACAAAPGAEQRKIARIEKMPNHPRPYVMRNWAKVARDYDALAFNPRATGEHLPLIWRDTTKHNYPFPGFGLPSYIGSSYQTRDNQHESINCIAAVVGASLVGIDKSGPAGGNFVRMCQKYFNKDNGQRLYLNHTACGTGQSFWYEAHPSLLFAQLLYLYPRAGELAGHMTIAADRMLEAVAKLTGKDGIPNFNHTAFNYQTMAPVDNGRWKEPDAAAAYAWFLYMTAVKTGQAKYRPAADACMRFLQQCGQNQNPFYEVLLPYGAVLAARMNAEDGRTYDVHKLLNWCFGPSVARPNFGVLTDRWGKLDAAGLSGGLVTGGGYAFAMNTFDQAATLAPLPRYADRYARAIGKYILNLANASRLFYANAHDDDHQTCAAWAHQYDKNYCIAYEGCRGRGRRHVTANADHKTSAGRIVSGNYKATRIRHEPLRVYEVLAETPVGDHDRLEHIWAIALRPATARWLHVDARADDAGDADRGFRFSFATKPDGPYKPLFTVTADRDKIHSWSLSAKLSGTLYVKVEDTDRTLGQRKPDRLHVDSLFIVYELSRGPYATGDWGLGGYPHPVATDFGLYGSSHVGYLGGIVRTTDVPEILRLDLLKTDWYHARAYPTWLYFNPHAAAKTVHLNVGARPRDLYDTVTNRFVARSAVGRTPIAIGPDAAALIVVCPPAGKLTRRGDRGKLLVDGIIVDHHASH